MNDTQTSALGGDVAKARPLSGRWLALDALRGLSLIGMLLNLVPGSWTDMYPPLVHAVWEGVTAIDFVAPIFLFCVGVSLPLSLSKRMAAGPARKDLLVHVIWRAVALVLLGLLLNAYPNFDWANMRIPGVIQRIGMAYGLVGVFMILTARREGQGLNVRPGLMFAAMLFIMLSYWALLEFVPVPGFGAPRYDPLGSWPSYIDRTLLGVPHMFPHWPVDGQVIYDPDGLLSTWPVCATVISGVLVGYFKQNYGIRPRKQGPLMSAAVMAIIMIGMGLALQPWCPIVKSLWTPTFVLLTSGVALLMLAALTALSEHLNLGKYFFPAIVYGVNPTAAYLICWIVAPVFDLNFGGEGGYATLRSVGQSTLSMAMPPQAASLVFSLIFLGLMFLIVWMMYRKRWFLKI